MIGIVVVTHGQLATELVNAARTIVGEIPAIAAVSIGWTDDPGAARESVERAMVEVGGTDRLEPVLILTDMFGGTPTNLSLPYLSPQVEIVTGVNLPMIIKLTSMRGGALGEVARSIRDQGKGAIHVASDLMQPRDPGPRNTEAF